MTKEFGDEISYEFAERLISELPKTWIPAMTLKIVEAGYEKNVWAPGACGVFVKAVEKEIGRGE